jgi:uncharacterized membrane protein YagU involved in acid resistance
MRPRPNLSIVFVGGLLGTPAMTALMYVLAPVFGVNTDIVTMLGEVLGGWRMGMLVHILNGALIFPVAFVFLLYRFLPGSPVIKGLAFGVLLWLTSQVVVMPIMGAGFFSIHIGGVKAVAASLLGHLAYGGLVGLFSRLAQEDWLGKPMLTSPLGCDPGRPEPKPGKF